MGLFLVIGFSTKQFRLLQSLEFSSSPKQLFIMLLNGIAYTTYTCNALSYVNARKYLDIKESILKNKDERSEHQV